jgi:DNA (cytosine-5)-methyltransferase 1
LNINKITNHNLDLEFILSNSSWVSIENKTGGNKRKIDISDLINIDVINKIINEIKGSSQTFEIPDFNIIQDSLGLNIVKGGNSNQKADILLDISNDIIVKENEGFGIKSYLGSKPTLLNASGNTNFIFKVKNLDKRYIDEINEIDTLTKLKDRLKKIEELGGTLEYVGAEKESMEFNLKMVDSEMPKVVGDMLICFYKERVSSLKDIAKKIVKTNSKDEVKLLENKLKKFLIDILLGFFAGSKWDGTYESNGTIVMKNNGDCL